MRSLLYNLFINHWQRKCISVVLSIVIWLIVNHSMTGARTIDNVAIRIINIPEDKTVDGIVNSGMLNKRISLTLFGSNTLLDDVELYLEVYIDAQEKPDEWIVSLTKKKSRVAQSRYRFLQRNFPGDA